MSKLEAENTEG